jgi:hypothetical protein
MAVYVKPNGLLGVVYMAAIKPFRYLIVYPALMRQIGREWRARPRPRSPTQPTGRSAAGRVGASRSLAYAWG